ncbi:MAG: hypothetical protein KBD63_01060 [Bacteriovoracaceae bacterium]|nr:hypothetical protein [Bacteriovoracaceae bacterium]
MKRYCLLFLFLGCGFKYKAENFYAENLKRWSSAFKISEMHPAFIEGKSPMGLAGIPQALFKISYLGTDDVYSLHDCVYYVNPSLQNQGTLAVIRDVGEKSCDTLKRERYDAKITALDNIEIDFPNDSYVLKITIIKKEKKIIQEYEFFNLIKGWQTRENGQVLKSAQEGEIFKSKAEDKLQRGLTIFSLKYKNKKIEAKIKKDQRIIKEKTLCHQVDDKCESTMPYQCNLCAEGFYEGAATLCERGGPKYCGISHCGEKNEPACPRGLTLVKKNKQDVCEAGSLAGICNEGLTSICENGVLVCK